MGKRLAVMLLAAVVGVAFAAGLFIHGRLGGVLLIVVDLILIGLARLAWERLPAQGRPVRLIVIAVVGVIGVAKLVLG